MTLWNGSFPFYAGTNACFPFNTTSAVIASVFLSALATSIIILPGIRGKGVSRGAGRAQPHARCTPCAAPFPASTADPGVNVPPGQGPADGQGCGISSEPRGRAPAQLPCRTPQPQIYRQPRSELGKFSVRFSLNDFTG